MALIKPIKPLFDLVEHEIKSIPYSLDVQYNDEYGYVEYFKIDPTMVKMMNILIKLKTLRL